ncbi:MULTISPECIES: DUF6668 family protein [Pimelobacter]|uniref:DUF6668 family protein n=1 Tax=Pimelobacter TaxID=2044 RepID=UPI001C0572AB|nr:MULTISPECIES: DUF6668 family protein [Pimelobacter]MBU2698834.1 hypothetical protein [Pimelobacter sp. 30-1]UUW93024.1 hypothetical protein M0M43_30490 [Pimelobacter simplex]UUW99057.1 hypothetical protein M0M48_30510 [Pimelobacter simplex]
MIDDPSESATAREHWARVAANVAAERVAAAAEHASTEAPEDVELDEISSAPSRSAETEAVAGSKRRFFSRSNPDTATAPAAAGVNPLLAEPGGAARRAASGRGEDDDELEAADEGGSGLSRLGLGHVTGPAIPPPAPTPLNPALRVPGTWPPVRPASGEHLVQVVGLHGGAGTSTMAALLGPKALDCGVGLDNVVDVTIPVLFVTRSHARGLDLARRAGQQFAARNLEPLRVLGLCVVQDAPTLSKGLARALRSVERSLPNCWTLPWDEDLRHDPALPPAADRGRIARDVRRILRKAARLRDRDDGDAEQPTGSQNY